MRPLTKREKFGLILVGIAAAFAVIYLLILPLISGWRAKLGEVRLKEEQLKTARALAAMEASLRLLSAEVENELGARGDPILSDELMKRLQESFSIDELNRATAADLMKVEGMDAAKAAAIVSYRESIGGFSSFEQLRELRSSAFKGDEQAVIIGRVSALAKRAGINKIDSLTIRTIASSKPAQVSQKAKRELIRRLFIAEVKAQLRALESGSQLRFKTVFPPIPPQLPQELRIRVARMIVEKGGIPTRSDYQEVLDELLSSGESSPQPSDEELLPIEEELLSALGEEAIDIDPKAAMLTLLDYSKKVAAKEAELRGIVYGMAASYKPRLYQVDLIFKTKLENLVRFIAGIKDSLKWIDPRGLRIGVADEKKGILSVQLTLIATVL